MFERLLASSSGRRRFVVYAAGDTDVESQFATRDISVERRSLPPGGPSPFLVIEEDDEFAGALPLATLESLLEPPVVRPGERSEVSEGYRILFDVLDETVFTAMDRRQLLAVSREIEDRAARVGSGTLRACFQRRAAFESQADVYRHLATETDLDVHVYATDGWTAPSAPDISYHGDRGGTLRDYWTLSFVGPVTDQFSCALVAREGDDGYDGVWTDDPELVQCVDDELASVA